MRLGLVFDHAGCQWAEWLVPFLAARVAHVEVLCAVPEGSVDYPDVILPLARGVVTGQFDGGVAVCGTGIGVALAANQVPQLRAASVWSPEVAALGRQHNNLNVLCLGSRVMGPDLAQKICDAWLGATFEGGRHQRRLDKLAALREPLAR